MELIATIGVGMLTNAVYDIVKNVSGKFVRNYDAKKNEKRLIVNYIKIFHMNVEKF